MCYIGLGKLIPLRNKNKEIVNYTIVDKDDVEKCVKSKWHVARYGVKRSKLYCKGYVDKRPIHLHTYVFQGTVLQGEVLDHINGNSLDNRRSNLRAASRSVNGQNHPKRPGTMSEYVGVVKSGKKWAARLAGDKLGTYETERHAAAAYNREAIRVFGEIGTPLNEVTVNTFESDGRIHMHRRAEPLPRNVVKQGKGYIARIVMLGTRVETDHLDTPEKASYWVQYLEERRNIILLRRHLARPILRNTKGQAILPNNKGAEIIVSEQHWYTLVWMGAWHVTTEGYAAGRRGVHKNIDGSDNPNIWTPQLHRYIMNAYGDTRVVNHKNGNRLDNTLENLELATYSVNAHCRRKSNPENALSRYMGVSRHPNGKYYSYIDHNHARYNCGVYATEEEAAYVRDMKATELYGSQAQLSGVTKPDNWVYKGK